ncbi:MAG TPA: glycosyltransferase family 4 protein, partial [Thermoanaerobaculia bacterium]
MKALLVADSPGHILERIARTFVDYGRGAEHRFVCSEIVSPYLVRRAGESDGMLHWLDPLAFAAYPSAARAPQVVMIHHLTEPEIEPMKRRLRHADLLTTSSRRWLRRLTGMTGMPVHLIPYTIDPDVFRPVENVSAKRIEHGIGSSDFVVGYSGKAAADAFGRKGLDILTAVLEGCAQRWHDDLVVVLVGSGWNDLSRTIESWGVRVVRQQLATTEETAEVYPLMDVLISTSREEGGPCTIIEAMGCGVPIITTDVGHVPELIVDGENGFVCAWPDPASEFISRIALLRRDRELRARLAVNGRRTVIRERDARIVIPRIDFAAIYAEAQRRYAMRPGREIATRSVALSGVGL